VKGKGKTMRSMLLTVCLVALAAASIGCGTNVKYTQVELRGVFDKKYSTPESPIFLAKGESVTITNPRIVEKLSSFFPGLGSGRKAFWRLLAVRNLELVFSSETGQRITVYTEYYQYWGSDVDRGDLDVSGDLRSYLEALFYTVEVRKAAATMEKQ
jgi:hypothetical protein